MELGWSKAEGHGGCVPGIPEIFCSKLCWHKPFPPEVPLFAVQASASKARLSNPAAKPYHWKPVIPQLRSGAGPRDRKAFGIVSGKDLEVL